MRPARITKANLTAIACIVLLLVVYAVLTWTSTRTKSPTFDEPYHAMAGWTHLHAHDFRIDCEDPPLWNMYSSLATSAGMLHADFQSKYWIDQPSKMWLQWKWMIETLYRTPGNDAESFIQRQRAMMLVLAIALGAIISVWAWQLGGPVASIVATALFAFDPNFIGHGALVKNDICFSLVYLASAMCLASVVRRATTWNVLLTAICCGVMLTTKFSGVLAAALLPAMLAARVLVGGDWVVWGRTARSIRHRIIAATAITVSVAAVGVISIWAVYGFRYAPTADPNVHLNIQEVTRMATANTILLKNGPGSADAETIANAPTPLFARVIRFADDHRLLPNAWLTGLLFTYQSALLRSSYMLGEWSVTGFRYYFPFAMLVKTPVATLLAMAFILMVLAARLLRRSLYLRQSQWEILSVIVPVAVYGVPALCTNLNIGVRHVFPLYALLFIAVGCVAGSCWSRWKSKSSLYAASGILLSLLAVETVLAFPNYIAFFNTAAGGARAGFYLLGDSNLDWGQDLKLLKKWQDQHADVPLYLSYFGLADPAYYGIRYTSLPGGYYFDPPPHWPDKSCVLAISATTLQGSSSNHELVTTFYGPLSRRQPTEILGGTIYLYDYSVPAK